MTSGDEECDEQRIYAGEGEESEKNGRTSKDK